MPEIIVKLGNNVVNKHYLYTNVVTIGRAPDNEISIENLAVSRRHAVITDDGKGQYFVEDNQSANGTFVNGVRVTKAKLQDKDVISVGKHKLYFYNNQQSQAPLDLAQKTMLMTSEPRPYACLRVIQGKQTGEVFELTKNETRLGRAADNDVKVNDWFVSKHHAVILCRGSSYVIRDQGSWRHTLVNGTIVEEQALEPGDEVQLGPKITMVFDVEGAESHRMSNGAPAMGLQDEALPVASPASALEEESEVGYHEPAGQAGEEKVGSGTEEGSEQITRPSANLSQLQQAGGVPDEQFRDEEADSIFDVQRDEHDEAKSEPPEDENDVLDFLNRIEDDEPEGLEDSEWQVQDKRDEEALYGSSEDELGGDGASRNEPVSDEDREAEGVGVQDESSSESDETLDKSNEILDTVSETISETAEADMNSEEIQMWLKALNNRSSVIRKQAQRKLKVLTGRDYEIE